MTDREWHVHRALSRLLDAHEEALDITRRALERGGDEQALEDTESGQRGSESFEEALMGVLDILDSATQDVRNILQEGLE